MGLVLNLVKELVRFVFIFKASMTHAVKMFENLKMFLGRCMTLFS